MSFPTNERASAVRLVNRDRFCLACESIASVPRSPCGVSVTLKGRTITATAAIALNGSRLTNEVAICEAQ